MKNILKRIGKFFWKNITEDEEEIKDDEEYNKFASKIRKRIWQIPLDFATNVKDPLQISLLIENVRMQKKITKTNESLKAATWVLALATIAFTVGTVYGVESLNKTIKTVSQIIGLLVIIGLAFFILKSIGKIVVKSIFKPRGIK